MMRRVCALLALLCVLLSVGPASEAAAGSPSTTAFTEREEYRIAVASDLYLNPDDT